MSDLTIFYAFMWVLNVITPYLNMLRPYVNRFIDRFAITLAHDTAQFANHVYESTFQKPLTFLAYALVFCTIAYFIYKLYQSVTSVKPTEQKVLHQGA